MPPLLLALSHLHFGRKSGPLKSANTSLILLIELVYSHPNPSEALSPEAYFFTFGSLNKKMFPCLHIRVLIPAYPKEPRILKAE